MNLPHFNEDDRFWCPICPVYKGVDGDQMNGNQIMTHGIKDHDIQIKEISLFFNWCAQHSSDKRKDIKENPQLASTTANLRDTYHQQAAGFEALMQNAPSRISNTQGASQHQGMGTPNVNKDGFGMMAYQSPGANNTPAVNQLQNASQQQGMGSPMFNNNNGFGTMSQMDAQSFGANNAQYDNQFQGAMSSNPNQFIGQGHAQSMPQCVNQGATSPNPNQFIGQGNAQNMAQFLNHSQGANSPNSNQFAAVQYPYPMVSIEKYLEQRALSQNQISGQGHAQSMAQSVNKAQGTTSPDPNQFNGQGHAQNLFNGAVNGNQVAANQTPVPRQQAMAPTANIGGRQLTPAESQAWFRQLALDRGNGLTVKKAAPRARKGKNAAKAQPAGPQNGMMSKQQPMNTAHIDLTNDNALMGNPQSVAILNPQAVTKNRAASPTNAVNHGLGLGFLDALLNPHQSSAQAFNGFFNNDQIDPALLGQSTPQAVSDVFNGPSPQIDPALQNQSSAQAVNGVSNGTFLQTQPEPKKQSFPQVLANGATIRCASSGFLDSVFPQFLQSQSTPQVVNGTSAQTQPERKKQSPPQASNNGAVIRCASSGAFDSLFPQLPSTPQAVNSVSNGASPQDVPTPQKESLAQIFNEAARAKLLQNPAGLISSIASDKLIAMQNLFAAEAEDPEGPWDKNKELTIGARGVTNFAAIARKAKITARLERRKEAEAKMRGPLRQSKKKDNVTQAQEKAIAQRKKDALVSQAQSNAITQSKENDIVSQAQDEPTTQQAANDITVTEAQSHAITQQAADDISITQTQDNAITEQAANNVTVTQTQDNADEEVEMADAEFKDLFGDDDGCFTSGDADNHSEDAVTSNDSAAEPMEVDNATNENDDDMLEQELEAMLDEHFAGDSPQVDTQSNDGGVTDVAALSGSDSEMDEEHDNQEIAPSSEAVHEVQQAVDQDNESDAMSSQSTTEDDQESENEVVSNGNVGKGREGFPPDPTLEPFPEYKDPPLENESAQNGEKTTIPSIIVTSFEDKDHKSAPNAKKATIPSIKYNEFAPYDEVTFPSMEVTSFDGKLIKIENVEITSFEDTDDDKTPMTEEEFEAFLQGRAAPDLTDYRSLSEEQFNTCLGSSSLNEDEDRYYYEQQFGYFDEMTDEDCAAIDKQREQEYLDSLAPEDITESFKEKYNYKFDNPPTNNIWLDPKTNASTQMIASTSSAPAVRTRHQNLNHVLAGIPDFTDEMTNNWFAHVQSYGSN